MGFEIPRTEWKGHIREVILGQAAKNGAEKTSVVVGSQSTLPFLSIDGRLPHPPVLAWEIFDTPPGDWVAPLSLALKDYYHDPLAWAQKAEDEGAKLICLTLSGTNPDGLNRPMKETLKQVESFLKTINVPLIIKGVGSPEHQGEVLSKCAEAVEGENCLLAAAVEENYRTIVAAAMAFGHSLVAETPIDVNLAKQLNILITDMNFPPEKIMIDPLTGGLGYGLEYTYSVMERIRLQALNGDPMMQMPFICFVGDEAWRVKEVRVPEKENPEWGDQQKRSIMWEISTATALLHAGADILVMRHPQAIKTLDYAITELFQSSG